MKVFHWKLAVFSSLAAYLVSCSTPTTPRSGSELMSESQVGDDADTRDVAEEGGTDEEASDNVLDSSSSPDDARGWMSSFSRGRGSPAEYDAGPEPGSEWARLFAQTPNYRGIGTQFMRAEKFRWKFGPMFYRGRLAPKSVKVFIVGQEGAQDESISNRSFTGGTGAKMQHVLNSLGVTKSYLFMNTFVYTINGQYSEPELKVLAQHPGSPITQHRHQLFDHMLAQNKGTLALVIAVGSAAQDSVREWIKHHGGECRTLMQGCDADVLAKGVKAIGVPHPGAAGKSPGALPKLTKAFSGMLAQVGEWSKKPGWLKPDVPGFRINPSAYRYNNAPVPFRDFAFGTMWRLGRGGTSSNRQDGQRSIQIFSAEGEYNSKQPYSVDSFRGMPDLYVPKLPSGEVAWEAPRHDAEAFDPGPGEDFAGLLMGTARGAEFPDFKKLGAISSNSFGPHGTYRGRLAQAELLIIGDQESHDDLFSGRALTGTGGQRLQAFLDATKLDGRYAIVRTIPVDTLGGSAEQILADAAFLKNRQALLNEILSKRKLRSIIAVGPNAQKLVERLKIPSAVKVGLADDTLDPGFESSIQQAAKTVGIAPVGRFDGYRPIPREQLPFQTKWWTGTSGDRGLRSERGGDYYKVVLPQWVNSMRPQRPSGEESDLLNQLPRSLRE